jgi:hypothetical protein
VSSPKAQHRRPGTGGLGVDSTPIAVIHWPDERQHRFAPMNADDRNRLTGRIRALMAKTVANGCTEEEELSAARMAGKLAEQLDGAPSDAAPQPETQPEASWAAQERDSPQYQGLLEKNTLEGLLKTALQELSLNHINTVSPPRRNIRGQPVEWVRTQDLLEPYLAMMLGSGGSRMACTIVSGLIQELILDGLLPDALAIPRGD